MLPANRSAPGGEIRPGAFHFRHTSGAQADRRDGQTATCSGGAGGHEFPAGCRALPRVWMSIRPTL